MSGKNFRNTSLTSDGKLNMMNPTNVTKCIQRQKKQELQQGIRSQRFHILFARLPHTRSP